MTPLAKALLGATATCVGTFELAARRAAPTLRRAATPVAVGDEVESALWPTWAASVVPDVELLYMPFLEHQLSVLEALGATEQADEKRLDQPVFWKTTPRLAYAEKASKDTGGTAARVGSRLYEVPGLFRRVRMTYFDGGPALQVFNSLWYPALDRVDAPLLGIDLLAFGPKKLLCVVDAQPLRGRDQDGRVAHETAALARIRAAHAELGGEVSSRWYDDNRFFSKQMLYSRFDESGRAGVKEALYPAFGDYLGAYVDVVQRCTVDPTHAATAEEHQRAYDAFNAARDPAHGLFTSYFGEAWANDFVHDFLFQLAPQKEEEEAERHQDGAPPSEDSEKEVRGP